MSALPAFDSDDERERLLEALRLARGQQRVAEEAVALAASLSEFIASAWHVLKPHEIFKRNWHIDAACYHLEAVSAGEIRRLQIWVPPATMKSISGSVMWPAWEWTHAPWFTYWAASYDLSLSWRLARMSREVIQSDWFQMRWPLPLTKEADGEFLNGQGGGRISTSPTSKGIGLHGHRILIDDAMDATAADSTSKMKLKETNDWYDSTIPGRMADPKKTAVVNIQQRLHENDLAGHLLEIEDWTVLCLPERFEAGHSFAWRGERVHPAVKKRIKDTPLRKGDPRKKDGDLLWPDHRDDIASNAFARTLRPHRAAGQLQQRPASREGEIIQRSWWRFYDYTIREQDDWQRLPKKIGRIIVSVDCPQKDKQSNDCFAMQVWGVSGADRFLLDLEMGQMNYNKAKRRVKEMALWARKHWPRVPHHVLIENAGYGVEMITDLRTEITGITKLNHSSEGDKEVRADAAADSLESGNQYLPGIGPPAHVVFNEHASPSEIVKFVDNLANFPHAMFDDDVDAWSQAMNWLRGRQAGRARVHTAADLIRAGR